MKPAIRMNLVSKISIFLAAIVLVVAGSASAADAGLKPLRVLLLTGGGYHDYEKLVPHLTNKLALLVNAKFDAKWDMEVLKDPKFADNYDAVLYDLCFDKAPDESVENAINAVKRGKPAVMIHCAVHAFRYTGRVAQWEECCGMRSKVHDRFEPFTVTKVAKSPITKSFPDPWKTEGDELYQTISIHPGSVQLLNAKSPQDGREHTVCWTFKNEKGRVFSTTLGHDMKTAETKEYLQLVANGLLWACNKLQPDGTPMAGYEASAPAK